MTPKFDLHLHLEGAAPPAFVRGLAREKHMDLSGLFAADGQYQFTGYPGFQRAYAAACSAVQTPQDYHRLTLSVLEDAAAAGVIYCEMLLSPDLCGGDLAAWRDRLEAISDASRLAKVQLGVSSRGLAIARRDLGPEVARKSALCAAETAGDWLVGFGLTGDETICAPKEFTWGFDAAREAGLQLFAEAGLRAGPQNIRDTIRTLGIGRIAHGARAIEDLALVDQLAEQGQVLVSCPAADLAWGLYPNWRAHPVHALRERGVKVVLATSHPAWVRTTMDRDQVRLAEAFDWDDGVFASIARTSIDAAFCDSDTRDRIAKKLEAAHA